MSEMRLSGTIMAVTGDRVSPVEALRVSGGGPSRPLRGVSGQPLVVPEGTYWVQALLPGDDGAGETTNAEEVVVRAGAESRVVLGEAVVAANETIAVADADPIVRPDGLMTKVARWAINLAAPVMLRSVGVLVSGAGPSIGAGDRFRRWAAAPAPGMRRWSGDPAQRLTFAGRSSMFVIVDRGREFLAVVPGAVGNTTTATVTSSQSEAGARAFPSLGLSFSDPVLDRLWQFTAAGSMNLARVMAEAVVRQADPAPGLHAALACYVLMRIGWDGDLLGFANAALQTAPNQPDLLVVKAELQARQGRHDDAAASLAALGTGSEPWPLLRPGIEYARKRIGIALEWGGSGSGLESVAAQIMLISAMMDPGALYLLLNTADAERTAALLYGVSSLAAPAPRPPVPSAARPSE